MWYWLIKRNADNCAPIRIYVHVSSFASRFTKLLSAIAADTGSWITCVNIVENVAQLIRDKKTTPWRATVRIAEQTMKNDRAVRTQEQ